MKKLIAFLCILFFVLPVQAKRLELVLWHGMAGQIGDEVRALADAFNQSQKTYWVKPVYKGSYTETLTSFAAAFRAQQPPAMVQIFEVGTALMYSPKGVIKPVEELMQEQGISLPQDDFISVVREFYSRNGRLIAFPFNLSVPILYYNRDALAKVGYTEENFPKTWDDMEVLAARLKKSGYSCVYTSAYPGWILFESFLALHGLPLTQGNPKHAVFDTPQLISHFTRLKRWHQQHYFRYAGRGDDATILFTSSICPLFSQSSGAYNSLSALVSFRLGVATMPLDTKVSPIRYTNVAGGAALWAVAGQSKEQYQGIARFFAFIAQPQTQQRWHNNTGYLPLGLQGVYAEIVKSSHHPNLVLAQMELQAGGRSLKYYGPQNQIRAINDEVVESMFAGLMSPDEAVHEFAKRANHVLTRFARAIRNEA
ncbi:MAG: extracellular solute-binding protein [Legionella sp.]|uniref:extracellular solute-binding protein n=1 Tax=Legionella sp. TaxID=459 RepID=UPI0039E4F9CA